MLQRLEHRLPLLTGGAPDLRERQQTLRHTLAWSHDLLGLLERRLFRRLAVFAGGWTLDAAEAVCSDGDLPLDEVLERLGVLVDTSLVVRTIAADDEQRFGMLETIREFAAECLRIADEERDTHTRHLAFFLARAEAVEPALHGAAQANLANRLEREHDNLRAALTWSLHSAQVVVGLRLAVALRYFWKMHGHHREGRYWLRALVEASTTVAPPDLQGRALGALGYLEAMQADYASAQGHLEQALALGRAVADLQIVVFAQRYLCFTANARGDFDSARRSLEQSFGLYRELGLEHEAGAFSLYLGDTAFGLGDRERAERLFEESSVRLQHLQDTTPLPYPLRRLAQLPLLRGTPSEPPSCASRASRSTATWAIRRASRPAWSGSQRSPPRPTGPPGRPSSWAGPTSCWRPSRPSYCRWISNSASSPLRAPEPCWVHPPSTVPATTEDRWAWKRS